MLNMKKIYRMVTTALNLLKTMRVFTSKPICRDSAPAITVLCFFLVCLNVWQNTHSIKRKYEDEQTKVGNLIPFDKIKFTLDNICNSDLSTENIEFVYKEYVKNNDVENRILNRDSNGNTEIELSGSSTETFTKTVNKLAHRAVKDGMDYIMLICNGTLPNNLIRDLTRYSIKKLREHIVPDVGIVVATEMGARHSTRPFFIVIHKCHIGIFHKFFPSDHDFNSLKAIHWIIDIYKPYHITALNVKKYTEVTQQLSVKFKVANRFEDKFLRKDRHKITDYIISVQEVLVISYSLYGSKARYTDGAVANTELVQTIYPGWKVWIYHDDSVPLNVISTICEKVIVKCVNMTGSMVTNKMSWRFLVASLPFVSRYIVRDIDSRLSEREKAAVDEWIVSGKKFHVMRDHPSHTRFSMSGGMWGGTRDAIPDMERMLRRVINDKYLGDMNFLGKAVWPLAQKSVYQHDSFSCNQFGGGHPFPTKRVGLEHVGSVYINGKMRKADTDVLKKAKPPEQCSSSSE